MASEEVVLRPFLYRPLDDWQIRVIDLEYCRDLKSPLRCRIRHIPLFKKDREEQYQTLSYAWGQSGLTRSLQIHYEDEERPSRLKISANLSAAPRRVRSRRRAQGEAFASLPLWCDAVCINQNNTDEKNRQVRLMAGIYGQSYRLLVWLGDIQPWRHDHALVRLLRNKANDSLPAHYHQNRARVESLLKSSWFERRWCIQEVFKSFYIRTWVLFGEQIVTQPDFCALLTRMGLLKQAGPLKWLYDYDVHHSLLENLQLFDRYKCGNELDLVYALLAISSDRALAMDPIWPHYGTPPDTLFYELARRYCTDDFLVPLLTCATTRGIPPEPDRRTYGTLPSWVPDWGNNISFRSDRHQSAAPEGPTHFCNQWMDCCDGSCGNASRKHEKAKWAAKSCCKHRIKLVPGQDIVTQDRFLVLKTLLWLPDDQNPIRYVIGYEEYSLPALHSNQALLTFEMAHTPDVAFCSKHEKMEPSSEDLCRQHQIELCVQHSMAFVLHTVDYRESTERSIFRLRYCFHVPNFLVAKDAAYRTTEIRIM